MPVLSEQITVAHPKVSTAGSLRIIALRRIILCTPIARAIVTIAGRPSGIAATARLTAEKNMSRNDSPRRIPIRPTSKQSTPHTSTSHFPSCVRRFCNGVSPGSAAEIIPAILPNSVVVPVSVTITDARPLVTKVPANTRLRKSPSACFPWLITASFFTTGSDSPVSGDSSTSKELHLAMRASAQMRSPLSRSSKSPGTTSLAGITLICRSRITFACGAVKSLKAASDFSARYSCAKPSNAFIITMAKIARASLRSPSSHEMAVAANKTSTIKSVNCSARIFKGEMPPFSGSLFRPFLVRRLWLSCDDNPFSASVINSVITALTVL